MAKKLTLEQVYNIKKTEWFNFENLDFADAKQRHLDNVTGLKSVEEWRKRKDRPIAVLMLHGSGRDTHKSCAHEKSNSQMLLERGMNLARDEWEGDLDVESFELRKLYLEPCNGCVSTASALCNFPCSCFPGDDITSKLYPAVMLADVLLWSTPVNQSMVSSRTKIVLDRLISLDGGYFTPELPVKNDDYRDKVIQLSLDSPVYDQRMFGKISAYFVSSKDKNNTQPVSGGGYPTEFEKLTYTDLVVGGIAHQGTEYGWFHADPFYVVSAADPDTEYSLDKDYYDQHTADHETAKEVVLAALRMAEGFKKSPPKFKSGGRINRT